MRSGPSRLTVPSAWCVRPYVAPTSDEVAQARLLELLADARERTARIGALREHVEQRGALLERLHQAAVGADLLDPHLVEQPGGSADEQLTILVCCLLERAADHEQERALARAEPRLVERQLDRARAEPRTRQALVQILGRPGDEARVDRLGERVAQVGDAAGRRDHDDHHEVALQRQHLDVPERRRPQRRAPRRARAAARPARASPSSPGALPPLRRARPAARSRDRSASFRGARAARRRTAGTRPPSATAPRRCADA